MQPLKYLRLVGAHFKNSKEIQRLMCQRPSAARGRMPWREHLNKTVHEMSRVETCRHWLFLEVYENQVQTVTLSYLLPMTKLLVTFRILANNE